jgi:ABC-2 type transport system permease protein
VTSWARQIACATVMAYRAMWRDLGIIVAFFFLFPLGFLFFLSVIVAPGLQAQVLVGALMMECGLININVLAQGIAGDKQSHLYDLWVSLPISPTVYVVGAALPWLPVTVLVSLSTLAVGILVFHISVQLAWWVLLPALVLVWGSTTGVGFLVAVYGGNPRMVNQLAQFVGIVMTFFAPVFYPLSALPVPLQYVAYVLPLTWGTVLLKALFVGNWAMAGLGFLALSLYAAVGFVLMGLGIRWRQS